MKKVILLIIFISLREDISAQTNLLINGDFEDYVSCPANDQSINQGQLKECSNPTNGSGSSPDYLNSCASVTYLKVPANGRGWQFPHSGNGYAGLWLWDMNVNFSEYIQVRLSDTLKQNHHYAFKCFLSRAEFFRYATADFGVYFSVDSVSMNLNILPFISQIQNPQGNYFTDTTNWMEFSGEYFAQGGERFVILGNFNDGNKGVDTLYQYWGAPNYQRASYYYIDDVSLIDLDSTLAVKENEGWSNFEVYPNPAKESITLSNVGTNSAVNITDITGKIVLQTKVSSGNQVDVSFFNAGLYFIYIENSKGRQMAKFVKE